MKFAAKYPHRQELAVRDLIAEVKDIRNNLLSSEEWAKEIKRQVGSAGEKIDNEHQLEEPAPQDQAVTSEATEHHHAISAPVQPHDDPVPPHSPEAYGLNQSEVEAEI